MSELLGEIVAWDLKFPEVNYTDVCAALRSAGLSEAAAPELRMTTAFSRACKHLKERRQIDRLEAKGDQASFQFTAREQTSDGIEFEFEARVVLDCGTGEVTSDERPELASQASDLLASAIGKRTASDVTRLVQRLFAAQADLYAIVPSKGVAYFVPDEHRPFIARVDNFLSHLGGKLCRFPVPRGTEEGNASVRDAVSDGLQSLVTELEEAVAGWEEKTRGATMGKAIERWQAIAYKADAYGEYLGAKQDEVRAALERAKEKLAAKIHELKPGIAEAAASGE